MPLLLLIIANTIEGDVVFLAPLCQGPHLLPVGCLVIVGNQAYYCRVVSKLDD